jgi:hypothetical protein
VLRGPEIDPIAKPESVSQIARDTKRSEIRSKRKIVNLSRGAAQGVEVILLTQGHQYPEEIADAWRGN